MKTDREGFATHRGKRLVVYHGTDTPFKDIKKGDNPFPYGPAVHVSTSPKYASEIAESREGIRGPAPGGSAPTVYPYHVKPGAVRHDRVTRGGPNDKDFNIQKSKYDTVVYRNPDPSYGTPKDVHMAVKHPKQLVSVFDKAEKLYDKTFKK